MGMKYIIKGKLRNGLIVLHPFSSLLLLYLQFQYILFSLSAGALFRLHSLIYISHTITINKPSSQSQNRHGFYPFRPGGNCSL